MNSLFTYLTSTIGNNKILTNQLAEEKYQKFDIAIFSKHKTKIGWQCEHGHITYTTLYKKEKGSKCLVCIGKEVLAGYNDLASQYPKIAEQWHPTKNSNLLPSSITGGSSKKVWWVCDKGHEWEANISSRTRNNYGCPYCANQKVLAGYNDLASQYPKIAKQWHPTKNGTILPTQIAPNSNKKFFWICNEGHTYLSSTNNATKGVKCGVCANLQTQVGYNSLIDTNPSLEKEYSEKNSKPFYENRQNSKTKAIWVCAEGHEWEASIYKRAILGRGCHKCSGYKLSIGTNDLLSNAPLEIIKSFDTVKNSIKIEELFVSSRTKIWWVCDKGHEWEAPVYSRTSGNGCRKCSKQVSQPEHDIVNFLLSLKFDILQNDRKILNGQELDIYIPEKNIAIEYNGLYWHSELQGKNKKYHYDKWLACKNKNIQLIQIWEDDYKRNPELIKNMLAHKLGVSQQDKIYARNTEVKFLSKNEADIFLDKYHIQGSVDGKIRVALISDNKPVAVMVLKTEAGSEGKTLNLLRFVTSSNVVGGFTKLLKYVETTYSPKKIITFSDNTISDGGLYESNGFLIAGIVSPDYMYIVQGKREHKFNYRLKRFKNDPNLIWENELSETELAKINNLPRIWDAGKIKWVKNL